MNWYTATVKILSADILTHTEAKVGIGQEGSSLSRPEEKHMRYLYYSCNSE